jgi:hypothetical protein
LLGDLDELAVVESLGLEGLNGGIDDRHGVSVVKDGGSQDTRGESAMKRIVRRSIHLLDGLLQVRR